MGELGSCNVCVRYCSLKPDAQLKGRKTVIIDEFPNEILHKS